MMEKEQGALMDAVEGPEGETGQSLEPSGTSNVTVQRGKCATLDRSGGDIFVFGHDEEKMDQVVGHAIFDKNSSHSNKKLATLIINGPEIGPLTNSDYLKTLSDNISKYPKPDVLVIILKGFTSENFSIFHGSGFVNANRATGMQIIIICCCIDSEKAKHASIWREFLDNIIVPSRMDEESTENNEMVVTHDVTNATYATVHKKLPQWTLNNEMMAGTSASQPPAKYADVDIEQSKMEKLTYFTVTPVLNEPSRRPRKSVVMGNEQPVGEGGPPVWTVDELDFDDAWGRAQCPVQEKTCWNRFLDCFNFALRR